jgi:hypothetical protein
MIQHNLQKNARGKGGKDDRCDQTGGRVSIHGPGNGIGAKMAGTESTMHLRETQDRDYPYFRRLWNSVVVALLAASFIPLLVIGGGMYYYTVSLLRRGHWRTFAWN